MNAALRDRFPELYQLLAAYLNQDFDIYGPTLEDAVGAYMQDADTSQVAAARSEIGRFKDAYESDLDGQLERLGAGYSREPGTTAAEFLRWLDGQLERGMRIQETQ